MSNPFVQLSLAKTERGEKKERREWWSFTYRHLGHPGVARHGDWHCGNGLGHRAHLLRLMTIAWRLSVMYTNTNDTFAPTVTGVTALTLARCVCVWYQHRLIAVRTFVPMTPAAPPTCASTAARRVAMKATEQLTMHVRRTVVSPTTFRRCGRYCTRSLRTIMMWSKKLSSRFFVSSFVPLRHTATSISSCGHTVLVLLPPSGRVLGCVHGSSGTVCCCRTK